MVMTMLCDESPCQTGSTRNIRVYKREELTNSEVGRVATCHHHHPSEWSYKVARGNPKVRIFLGGSCYSWAVCPDMKELLDLIYLYQRYSTHQMHVIRHSIYSIVTWNLHNSRCINKFYYKQTWSIATFKQYIFKHRKNNINKL